MNAPRTTGRRNERGVVIIWTAFFMLMMLGFVAIGVDVAKIMATRTELQNAADAAALAGASGLDMVTGTLIPDSAVARAQQTALRNEAFVDSPKPITLLAGDVITDVDDRTVKVTVRRDAATDGAMITHVAQVLGIKNVDVSATATAKADIACEQCEKLVPLGAVPPPGGAFQFGCANVYKLLEGQGGGAEGNWLALTFPECDEGSCFGMPNTGASTLRCLITSGYACCISANQVIDSEPGSNTGPVRSSLQARWDADSDRRADICFSNYAGNGMRIINVPIIDPLVQGRSTTRVRGFAAFFMKRRPAASGQTGEVWAEFVHDMVPGTAGVCNSSVFTLHLIQ
jgi:Flp pilus assembly protein TadG